MVIFHKDLPFWVPLSDGFKKGFAIFCLAFVVLWSGIALYHSLGEYYRLIKARRAGTFYVVEGKVMDFDPLAYKGHQNESFTVNGKHFEYSDYWITNGFNRTASHGGPIQAGLQVRISYVGNTIIKLEVEE